MRTGVDGAGAFGLAHKAVLRIAGGDFVQHAEHAFIECAVDHLPDPGGILVAECHHDADAAVHAGHVVT